MKSRIVITGIGFICPAGIGTQAPWEFIIEGRSAVKPVTHFDPTPYRSNLGAEVRNWDPTQFISSVLSKRIDKVDQFSLAAATIALKDAGIETNELNSDRLCVCLGTGLGGLFFGETQLTAFYNYGPKRVHPLTVPNVNPNAVATHISMQWNALGPNLTISTACASGSHALGQALMLLRAGKADVMIAGGVETPIMPMTYAGFDAMRIMATEDIGARPFDLNRNGFVLGEGAAILTLETEAHAKKRGAKIYAELAGYGANNGGFHVVAPRPDGLDAAKAVGLALEDAEVSPNDVGYINAHGTATQANDLSETNAIKAAFQNTAHRIPISSTKGATGHMIGAAGAVEAGFTALALYHQLLPPTANYETPDPNCDLDYIPRNARDSKLSIAISNSFGFGNNNSCLVFKTYK